MYLYNITYIIYRINYIRDAVFIHFVCVCVNCQNKQVRVNKMLVRIRKNKNNFKVRCTTIIYYCYYYCYVQYATCIYNVRPTHNSTIKTTIEFG